MDVRGCLLRFILVCLVAVVLTVAFQTGASAEAQIVKAWPPPDGLVGASDRVVSVVFGEPLSPVGSALTVTRAADGSRVDAGDGRLGDSANHVLTVTLRPNLPSGKYRVNWTAVSAKDGSTVTGDYAFTITPFLKAEPPPGGEIKGSPRVVTVAFAERLKGSGHALLVTDDAGARVDLGDAGLDPADPAGRTLRVSLPADLRTGKHFVKWTAALADDRVVSDSYGFTVYAFAPGPPSLTPATLPPNQPLLSGQVAPGVPAAPSFRAGKSDEPFFQKDAAGREVTGWRDNSDNESGFVLEVTFQPSGERHLFRAPANATSFTFPDGFTFRFRTPEECSRRKDLWVFLRAVNAAGESAPATFTVQRECFDLPTALPGAGSPVPAWPLALLGGALAAAGCALRQGWWRA